MNPKIPHRHTPLPPLPQKYQNTRHMYVGFVGVADEDVDVDVGIRSKQPTYRQGTR